MIKPVYIVTMYRYGNREMHSYIKGAYFKKSKALLAAEDEQIYRGGNKYIPEVLEVVEDKIKTILELKPTFQEVVMK